jgi:hypothetical protein
VMKVADECHTWIHEIWQQERLYHVCGKCTAKWFSRTECKDCPRCGSTEVSPNTAVPPWAGGTAACLVSHLPPAFAGDSHALDGRLPARDHSRARSKGMVTRRRPLRGPAGPCFGSPHAALPNPSHPLLSPSRPNKRSDASNLASTGMTSLYRVCYSDAARLWPRGRQ